MKNRTFSFLIALVLFLGILSIGTAENITQPRADLVFSSGSILLDLSKNATFRFVVKTSKSNLSVVSCYLEHYISGEWVNIRTLTPPSLVLSGTAYSCPQNYASAIGTGRYRIWATFSADGHTLTRCSNEQTY